MVRNNSNKKTGMESGLPPATDDRLKDVQRKAYLSSRQINPNAPFQLDLLFPGTLHEHTRAIPNDYARSALFTARNRKEPRRTFQQQLLFHLHESVSILFTGIELRAEDDELIWMQILHYAKKVPLGQPFDIEVKDLVAGVGWAKNGRYYDKARECISRLKANEILALNSKAYGSSGAVSLIDKYEVKNDGSGKPTQYRIWIHPNLIHLFAGNTFTNHSWEVYRNLTPVARRLADYIESHKHPHPLDNTKLHGVCDSSDNTATSWRQTVRAACREIEDAQIAKRCTLERDGLIYAHK